MNQRAALSGNGDAHLDSPDEMSAGRLRDRVVAARVQRGMSMSALQRVTGLSARTLRDIEAGNPTRRYGPTTLAALDEVFDWEPGTAYEAWRAEAAEDPAEVVRRAITEQMTALADRVTRMEEQPSWAAELVAAVRLLSPEDRATVLALVHRLGR